MALQWTICECYIIQQ